MQIDGLLLQVPGDDPNDSHGVNGLGHQFRHPTSQDLLTFALNRVGGQGDDRPGGAFLAKLAR